MANAYMGVVPLDHARHDVGTGACRARSKVKRPGLLHLGVCEKGGDGVQPMRAGEGGEVVVVKVVVPDHDLVVAPLHLGVLCHQ